MEYIWNDSDRENLGEKPATSATLSTTNPTCVDLGSNPELRGQEKTTNRLSHGTASYGLKLALIKIKYSVRMEQQIDSVYGTKTSNLMLYRKINCCWLILRSIHNTQTRTVLVT
jgi:hypothetical protein